MADHDSRELLVSIDSGRAPELESDISTSDIEHNLGVRHSVEVCRNHVRQESEEQHDADKQPQKMPATLLGFESKKLFHSDFPSSVSECERFVRTITLKSYHWFSDLQNENNMNVTKITKMSHNFRTNSGFFWFSAEFSIQISGLHLAPSWIGDLLKKISHTFNKYRKRDDAE